ncbi:hypothetical protein HELRODRAFT_108581 [Helobdella robusta]|uniref:Signal transducing adapter molecule 1 n=1 Tax=Helobdella robusta TaxID=6412 RepID=T1EEK5_HELRO|nr:hypothetical protein HELRODRAFT_108581 [Helobdella robusta]ESN90377.1 hypothetical protein HELRODRAFT_108581 [Helobdella robusta]
MTAFNGYSSFDGLVEKTIFESKELANLFKEVSHKVLNAKNGSKECLISIMKKLNSRDPHASLMALNLLEYCAQTCGHKFRLEVACVEFAGECRSLLNSGRLPKNCSEKLKALIKKWAENEFKSDPTLYHIPQLYMQLKNEGYTFHVSEEEEPKLSLMGMLTSEDDDLAKAIALSLKETTLNKQATSQMNKSVHQDVREVKTLYDFEAVEDNELTFKAGEIIKVLDDSDPNWWKGSSCRGEGLFPANFVTADLTTDIESEKAAKVRKSVHFQEEVEVVECSTVSEIDEEKINETLNLIQNSDPEEDCDPAELLQLEEQCKSMSPLIDQELEKIDKQHITLMEYNQKVTDAFNMYHSLMAELPMYNYPIKNQMNDQVVAPSTSSFPSFLPSFSSSLPGQMLLQQHQQQQRVQDMSLYTVKQPNGHQQQHAQFYAPQSQIPPLQQQQLPQQFKQEATVQQQMHAQHIPLLPQQQIHLQQVGQQQQMLNTFQQPVTASPDLI